MSSGPLVLLVLEVEGLGWLTPEPAAARHLISLGPNLIRTAGGK